MNELKVEYSKKDIITASEDAWQGGYDRAIVDVLMYLDGVMGDEKRYKANLRIKIVNLKKAGDCFNFQCRFHKGAPLSKVVCWKNCEYREVGIANVAPIVPFQFIDWEEDIHANL